MVLNTSRLIVILLFALLCPCLSVVKSQVTSEKWQRVYTGEDSNIDVDTTSLTFLDQRIVRVIFRTTFLKPEHLPNRPEISYQNQLETTEFKLNEPNYRLAETILLDSTGKTVMNLQAKEGEGWRAFKNGGMMQRLFHSINDVTPLGKWKVVGVRSSSDGAVLTSADVAKLVNTDVILSAVRAQVGNKTCSSPLYVSETLTKEGFLRKLGITSQSLSIQAEPVEAIVIKCVASDWRPPQSLLVKLDDERMLILWDGVFLELKKD